MTIVFDDGVNGGSAVSHWRGFAHIGLDLRAERERMRGEGGRGGGKQTARRRGQGGKKRMSEGEGKKETGPERMRAT